MEGPSLLEQLHSIEVHLTVRRRRHDAKWGIDLNKQLQWIGTRDASNITRIALGGDVRTPSRFVALEASLSRFASMQGVSADVESLKASLDVLKRIADVSEAAAEGRGSVTTATLLQEAKTILQLGDDASVLAKAGLQLVRVNGGAVSCTRDVAAQFLQQKHALSMQLVFRPTALIETVMSAWQHVDPQEQETEVDAHRHSALPPWATTQVGSPRDIVELDQNSYRQLETLPTEITVVLTRDMRATLPTAFSWGLEVSKSTMALSNLASLDSGSRGGDVGEGSTGPHVSGILIPPVTEASARRLLLQYPHVYQIAEVNQTPVNSVGEVAAAAAAASMMPPVGDVATSSLILLLRKHLEGFTPICRDFVEPVANNRKTVSPPQAPPLPTELASPLDVLRASAPDVFPFPTSLHHFTVVIRRPLGATRWGMRLASNTLRLKSLPRSPEASTHHTNRHDATALSSDVLAASPSVARAIADALQRSPSTSGAGASDASQWLPYAFYVTGLDQEMVTTNAELVAKLSCRQQAASITLQCVRVSLPRMKLDRVEVPPRRQETNTDSKPGAWGFRIRSVDATLMKVDPSCSFGLRLQAVLEASRRAAPVVQGSLQHAELLPSLARLLGDARSAALSTASRLAHAAALQSHSNAGTVLSVDDDDDDDHVVSTASGGTQLPWWTEGHSDPDTLRWQLSVIHVGGDVHDLHGSSRDAARMLQKAQQQ
jgi:hypothetical protein